MRAYFSGGRLARILVAAFATLVLTLPGLLQLSIEPVVAIADVGAVSVDTPKQTQGTAQGLPSLVATDATRAVETKGLVTTAKPPKKALPAEMRAGVVREQPKRVLSEQWKLKASSSSATEPPCGSYPLWQKGIYLAAGTHVRWERRVWKATQNIPANLNGAPPNAWDPAWQLIGDCPKPPPPTITSITPDTGIQVMTTQPTFTATATTWAGGSVSFDFIVCTSPELTGCSVEGEDCCALSGSWTPPEGVLQWGRQYWWYVRASDATTIGGLSSTSSARTFVIGVRQPTITSRLSTPGGNGQEFHQLAGNYTTRFTDAEVTVVGPPLSVVRSYNSMDPRRNGAFGAGWSTRWDMRVVHEQVRGREALLVTYPDGSQVRFAKKSDGTYQPPPGMHATLAEASASPACPSGTTCQGWALMDKSSTTYMFDESGRLTKIIDRRGRAQRLVYGSDGKLAQVSAPGGRSLRFTWTGAHVTSVSTDPVDGKTLTWTYSYDGDVLEKVCNPLAHCTVHGHAPGSLYRTTVLDSDPMGYWRLGEVTGYDAKDLGWNGESGSYTAVTLGKPGALAGTPDTAVELSASAKVELPDGLATRLGRWATLELWVKSTAAGPVLTFADDWGRTQHHVLQITADGRLSAAYLPTSTPITSGVPINDGAWHHVTLTVAGDAQVLYLDGKPVGTLTQTISDTGDWSETWVGGLIGAVDEVAVYDRPLSEAEAGTHFAARSEAPHKLTKITLPSGRVWAANAYEPVSDRIKTHTDQNGGTWQLGEPVYDRMTGMSTVTVTDPQQGTLQYVHDAWRGYRLVSATDQLGKKTTYEYDTGGFLRSVVDPNNNSVDSYYDERGNVVQRRTCRGSACQLTHYSYYWNAQDKFDARNDLLVAKRDARSSSPSDNTYATSWEYSQYGEQTEETSPATPDFPQGRSVSIAYTDGSEPAVGGGTAPAGLVKSRTDARNNVWEQRYTSAGDLAEQIEPEGMRTAYTYDVIGRPISRTETSKAFPDGVKTTFTYDGMGRLLTHTGAGIKNEVTGKVHTSQTRHTYDHDGNKLTDAVIDLTGGDPERTITYTYDAFGRPETVTGPEGGLVRTTWDNVGARTTVIDELGSVFAFTYTKRGELASRTLKNWTGSPVNPQPTKEIVLDAFSYDPGGRLATHADAMGRKTSYTYYDDGLLSEVIADDVALNGSATPRDVFLTEYRYDAAGNPIITIEGGGKATTEYVYDAASRLTSYTFDPTTLGRKLSYSYDANDNITTATLTGKGTTRSETVEFAYNKENELVRTTAENGDTDIVTSRVIDDRGHVTAVVGPRGNLPGADPTAFTTAFRYDEAGRLVESKAPEVQIEKAGQAQRGRPTTRYGYDSTGRPTHTLDAENRLAVNSFDRLGRLTKVTAPSYTPPGGAAITPATLLAYDEAGRVTKLTDPRGQITTAEYDALGNRVRVTDPSAGGQSPGQWVTEYDLLGEPLASVDPIGARSEATYDDLGRTITMTEIERKPTATAFTTQLEYDDAGSPVKTVRPGGKTTSYTTNAAGEVATETDPMGFISTTSYDPAGRVVKETDPLKFSTAHEYDRVGRLLATKDLDAAGAVLRTQSYTYDVASNTITSTSGEGHVTRKKYDAANALIELIEPVTADESIITSFGYDATGAETRSTDGRGNTVWTSYNALGLVESIIEPATQKHPNLADRTWTYTYDAVGNLTSLLQPGGVRIDQQWDELGRLVKESGTGAQVATPDRTYGHDQAGRRTSIGDYALEYNDRGLLTSVKQAGGQIAGFSYDAAGNPLTRSDTSGNATFTWDKSDRLATAVDPVTGRSYTFGYDENDRLTSLNSANPATSQIYAYDDLSRLFTHTLRNSGGAQVAKITYKYDKDDNIVSKVTQGTADAGTNTYGYDQVGRLTSWTAPGGDTTAYAWDASGNRTAINDNTFSYDERNRIVLGAGSEFSYTPRGTLATKISGDTTRHWVFDAFDRLISDGEATYSYDALGRLVSRKQGTDEKRFTYSGLENDIVSVANGAGAVQARYGRTPFGALLSLQEGSDPALGVLSDQHGDVIGTFSGTGMVDSTSYNPLGETTGQIGSRRTMGYQGEYTDPETGKVNMHARWYDPGTGAFMSRDDMTLDPSSSIRLNRYAYAEGDPITGQDPSGHHCYRSPPRVESPNKKSGKGAPSDNASAGGSAGPLGIAAMCRTIPPLGAMRPGGGTGGVGGGGGSATRNTWNNSNSSTARGQVSQSCRKRRGCRKDRDDDQPPSDPSGCSVERNEAKPGCTGRSGVNKCQTHPNSPGCKPKKTSCRQNARECKKTDNRTYCQKHPKAQSCQKRTDNRTYCQKYPNASGCRKASSTPNCKKSDCKKTDTRSQCQSKRSTAGCNSVKPSTRQCSKPSTKGCKKGTSPEEQQNNRNRDPDNKCKKGPCRKKRDDEEVVTIDEGSIAPINGHGYDYRNDFVEEFAETTTETIVESVIEDVIPDLPPDIPPGVGSCMPGSNSFIQGTRVLMADGTTKRIETIKVGDSVMATDPETGRTAARPVKTTITGDGTKRLVRLTVDTDGNAGTATNAITATDGHPFWIPSLRTWLSAGQLEPGMWLRTSAGTHVQITTLEKWTATQRVHNLTVDGLHTYHVVAGDQAILVHNAGPGRGLGDDEIYLWRAVQDSELADIHGNRSYSNPPGYETKYFAFTEEGAREYGRRAYGVRPQEGPYTVTRTIIDKGKIPSSSIMPPTVDVPGGGVALPTDVLPELGRPRIMPYSSCG